MKQEQANLKPSLYWKHILVPVDCSDASKYALNMAAGLAEQSGARLTLLHIIHVASCYPPDALQDMDDIMNCARDSLETTCRGVSPDLIRQKLAVFGKKEISEEIIQAALDLPADLIVIASHGRSGLGRFLQGSIAEKVVRHAPCPVLVMQAAKNIPKQAHHHFAEPMNPFKKTGT